MHVVGLNSASFAGHSDWRVPNFRELGNLLDLGRANPAVAPVFHTNCTPGCTVLTCSCTGTVTRYWSSTSIVAGSPALAWLIDFGGGYNTGATKTAAFAVRAVRGP